MGSACSGTDLAVASLKRLFGQFPDFFRVTLALNHVWSCENSLRKRCFIALHYPKAYIFTDLADLVQCVAIDHTGVPRLVSQVLFFIAGFSCKS